MRPFIIALINGNQKLVGLQCALERVDVRLNSNWHSFLLSIGAFFSPQFALSLPHFRLADSDTERNLLFDSAQLMANWFPSLFTRAGVGPAQLHISFTGAASN